VKVVLSLGLWILLAWVAASYLVVRKPLNKADAILVLAGSSAFRERTELAADLYRKGLSQQILISNDNQRGGWSSAEQRNPFFYEGARENLVRLGVPRDSIEVLPETVSSTYDEANALREYMTRKRTHSVLVVTSSYHSRRALWILQRVLGTEVEVGIEPVAPGNQSPPPSRWWLHLRGWQQVPGEYAKLIYYRINY